MIVRDGTPETVVKAATGITVSERTPLACLLVKVLLRVTNVRHITSEADVLTYRELRFRGYRKV